MGRALRCYFSFCCSLRYCGAPEQKRFNATFLAAQPRIRITACFPRAASLIRDPMRPPTPFTGQMRDKTPSEHPEPMGRCQQNETRDSPAQMAFLYAGGLQCSCLRFVQRVVWLTHGEA